MDETTALRAKANAGDSGAQIMLAYQILVGNAAEQSPGEVVRLVDAACATRNPNAFLMNAALAACGVGRPKKIDDAHGFIKQAAALGNKYARDQLQIVGVDKLDRDTWFKPIHLNQLHASPRIFSAEGFLPSAACDWLIKYGKKKLSRGVVYNPKGGFTASQHRTNSASNFSVLEGDLVLLLACRRAASATATPLLNQEPTTVLHYAVGEQFLPHHDFIRTWGEEAVNHADEVARSGQRAVTVLVYLNDDYEGGETEFPILNLRFKGKKGDALLFWSISEAGEVELDSLHAGLPVTKGEKWLLSKWIRQKPYPLV